MSNLLESASHCTANGPGEDNPGGWAGTAKVSPLRDHGIATVPIGQPTANPGNLRTPTQVCAALHPLPRIANAGIAGRVAELGDVPATIPGHMPFIRRPRRELLRHIACRRKSPS